MNIRLWRESRCRCVPRRRRRPLDVDGSFQMRSSIRSSNLSYMSRKYAQVSFSLTHSGSLYCPLTILCNVVGVYCKPQRNGAQPECAFLALWDGPFSLFGNFHLVRQHSRSGFKWVGQEEGKRDGMEGLGRCPVMLVYHLFVVHYRKDANS